MTRASRAALAAIPILLILLCGFSTGTANVPSVPFVVTSTPKYDPLAALHGGDRFPKGAQLLLVRDGKAEPLLADFAASADASVSFDAKNILFAGTKAAAAPWQVWEVTLADHSVRQVTTGSADAVRPLYLPGRRLVFAHRGARGFQIIAAGFDDKDELPLTYMSANALPADVLADGRILFEAGYPLGSGATPELFLVYSDGSGVESYRCDHGSSRWGGRQLASGDVVFSHGASLARFTSPLAHEDRIAVPRADYAGGVTETAEGDWLISTRPSSAAPFAVKLWKRANGPASAPMTEVLSRPGENLVEPVLLAPRARPKQHPSALHDWNYANLLTLDARQSREGDLKSVPASIRLETMDNAGRTVPMGTSPVESDGSFFVKVPGDRPIRFVLLDSKGAAVRQEHGWFWIRRGEQRICVGCHTGPERASENNVPAVLLRSTIPTDLTSVKAPGGSESAAKGNR